MCCPGCAAVAETIVAAGNESFYRVRSGYTPGVRITDPGQTNTGTVRDTRIFDRPEVERQFVHAPDPDSREACLQLEGVTCAACSWLIERQLAALDGLLEARVNYATRNALLRWDPSTVSLGAILDSIESIGYRAVPAAGEHRLEARQQERRRQQRRLAVAGLFGMQVMMLSIGLYAGAWSGIEREFEQLFRWLAMALTLPVIAYSAAPFFAAAVRDLARGAITMNLSVSLAIGAAFLASLWATVEGHGEIYFDSVVMFVFFLGASRYFEGMARQRCGASIERLLQSMPLAATRIGAAGSSESVAAAELAVGDRVLVPAGETVPADGEITEGHSAVDESLLSGESLPLEKRAGDKLFGGSINRTNPLELRVTAIGADTVVASIQRSMERALADRPPLALLADRVAARFIAAIFVLVAAAAVYWWLQRPEHWFETALAVLIVSCPCALSLSVPAALSATLGRLQSQGILVKRAAALESMQHLTHVVFDKTGTLTCGEPVLEGVFAAPGQERDACLRLAAALGSYSRHPLALALVKSIVRDGDTAFLASEVESVAGGGIIGRVDGREYRLGSATFVEDALLPEWREEASTITGSRVYLASAGQPIAMFAFSDELRDDAAQTVDGLRRRGLVVMLMSGDRREAAESTARALGIDEVLAGLSPDDKRQAVVALQAEGASVMMVGDGINDAPVLAAADVSLAMGTATALARGGADILLLSNRLRDVERVILSAARTRRIVLQNLGWALIYNFGAIPLAALGLVTPWLAALGMSASSLVVVVNALRLAR